MYLLIAITVKGSNGRLHFPRSPGIREKHLLLFVPNLPQIYDTTKTGAIHFNSPNYSPSNNTSIEGAQRETMYRPLRLVNTGHDVINAFGLISFILHRFRCFFPIVFYFQERGKATATAVFSSVQTTIANLCDF